LTVNKNARCAKHGAFLPYFYGTRKDKMIDKFKKLCYTFIREEKRTALILYKNGTAPWRKS